MKSIRITILAAGMALQGFANAPLKTGKPVNTEQTRAALPTKDANPAAAKDREQPRLVSPICHGACKVASPWQTYLIYFAPWA